MEKTESKDRIAALLNFLKVSAKELADTLEMKRPDIFYHILSGRNGISRTLATSITTKYNNISYNWLLTGEGEMLKSDSGVGINTAVNEVAELKKVIEDKDKQIADLFAIIKNLQDTQKDLQRMFEIIDGKRFDPFAVNNNNNNNKS